jgi:ABC-type branched-subunit amino acid transport system permease subunit
VAGPTRWTTLCRQQALSAGDRRLIVVVAVGLVALGLLPPMLGEYGLSTMRDALIMSLFALSLDFLWGRAHILCLGHAVFFGLGAYGMAIGTIKFMLGALTGLLVGIGAAAMLAAVVGYFLIYSGVRLHFFAIVTMALSLIVGQLAVSWSSFTGGDIGILGVPNLNFFGGKFDLSGPYGSYYLALGLVASCLLLLWLAGRSNYGKVLAALGMNELRANSLGHDTSFYLLAVFVVTAALAGLSGGLFAAVNQVVAPDLFSVVLSTEAIAWVAVGGRGTLIGPVVATLLISRLQLELSSWTSSLWPILIGTLFILQVVFLPDGLASLRRLRWLAPGRALVSPETN